ncbi:MAG: DNA polymerase III subunit gamma/tau [Micavibrio sp.]|nr:DNA polymerase III subunit gamma/tau [Micavibrio sp.]
MAESKPYLVFARKYRPQSFDEVMGQEPVSTTLKNAIALGRIGHAYLFTGPRGVGKTSMARIFAKALNCKKGPTAKPCGECVNCQEIENTRSLDVQEIDGASNRGIDEIRALRENVKFAPAAGKFKIYIIDEVHQITTDGFNALLKTLEEPPAHVKFIFATTSAQKVPATILSRCQRFDFRRIPTDTIAATLKEICKQEKIKADETALYQIAKAADGSLRDSQTLLDQIAAAGSGKIGREDVERSLGVPEEERVSELVGHLAAHDAKKALLLLDRVLKEGKDPALFMEALLGHVRDLLFIKTSESLSELIDASEAHRASLSKQTKLFSKEDLFYFFSVIAQTLQVMKRFESKRIPLEVALVKLAENAPVESIEKLITALKNTEKKTSVNSPSVMSAPVEAVLPELPKKKVRVEKVLDEEKDEIEELPTEDAEIKPEIPGEKSPAFLAVWNSLLASVKTEKISLSSYLAEGEPLTIENGIAQIAFPEKHSFHRETLEADTNRRLIEKHLSELIGKPLRIEFQSVKDAPGSVAEAAPAAAPAKPSAETENALKSAAQLFGGRVIR